MHAANYKLAIFDFDGTLANTFPFFVESFNTLAEKYRFRKVSHAETEALRGESARSIIKHVGLPMWKVPFVGAHFKKLMAASIHRIQPFDGVGDMLRHCTSTASGSVWQHPIHMKISSEFLDKN